jgi:hypothetical protein
MAYNQSVNFQSPNSPDAQDYAIQQAQALAQALQQQAFKPIETHNAPISWTQGLAQMADAYLSKKQSNKVKDLLNQKDRQAQAAIQKKLSLLAPTQAPTLEGFSGPTAAGSAPDLLRDPNQPTTQDSAPVQLPHAQQLAADLSHPGQSVPVSPQAQQLGAMLEGMPNEAKNQFLTQALANKFLPQPLGVKEVGPGGKIVNLDTGQTLAENAPLTDLEHVSRPLANDMVQEGTFNKRTGTYQWGEPHKGHEPAAISMLAGPEAQSSIDSDARLVAMGKAPLPPFGGMGASGVRNGEVRKRALALNSELDGTIYGKRKAAENSFAASIDGRNLDSYNTIAQHVAFGEQAYQALQNGDIPALNRLGNTLGIQTQGLAPADAYRNIATFLGNETARATIGGQSGEADRGALSKMFSDAASPAMAAANYAAAKALIGGRIMSSRRRFESSVKTYDPDQKKWVSDSGEFDAKLTPAALEFENIAAPSPATAPPAAPITKTIGGVTYVKRGNDWFPQ